MVFITAGRAAARGPVGTCPVAEISRELNALTIGVVAKPFDFEGRPSRRRQADEGVETLQHAGESHRTISCSSSPSWR